MRGRRYESVRGDQRRGLPGWLRRQRGGTRPSGPPDCLGRLPGRSDASLCGSPGTSVHGRDRRELREESGRRLSWEGVWTCFSSGGLQHGSGQGLTTGIQAVRRIPIATTKTRVPSSCRCALVALPWQPTVGVRGPGGRGGAFAARPEPGSRQRAAREGRTDCHQRDRFLRGQTRSARQPEANTPDPSDPPGRSDLPEPGAGRRRTKKRAQMLGKLELRRAGDGAVLARPGLRSASKRWGRRLRWQEQYPPKEDKPGLRGIGEGARPSLAASAAGRSGPEPAVRRGPSRRTAVAPATAHWYARPARAGRDYPPARARTRPPAQKCIPRQPRLLPAARRQARRRIGFPRFPSRARFGWNIRLPV